MGNLVTFLTAQPKVPLSSSSSHLLAICKLTDHYFVVMITHRYGGHVLGNIIAGSGPIWLDDVSCLGTEIDIASCPHSGWGIHNCDHSEDVSISCGPITEPNITGIIEARCSLNTAPRLRNNSATVL